jgi:hypothetical protein
MGADVDFVRALIGTFKIAAYKDTAIANFRELCQNLDQYELSEEEKRDFRKEIEEELEKLGVKKVRKPEVPAIGEELKMFCCERGEAEWMGGLLIMARDKDEAIGFYKEWEKTERDPYKTTEVDITTPGVVYDDKER